MTPRRSTQVQLKRQNRRLVLRALYRGEANTRVALSQDTGLSKPTISNLVSELLNEGLIIEEGRGQSSDQGGKRPTLLAFRPEARQLIGVAVLDRRVSGVLSSLDGSVTARHELRLDGARGGPALLAAISAVVEGLWPQADAPLLSIGVALPGKVDGARGVVRRSASLGLSDEPLGPDLARHFGLPVHVGNYAELCALGELAFGSQDGERPETLATLVLDDTPDLGVSQLSGSMHYGSELAGPMIDELGLDWRSVLDLAARLAPDHPGSVLGAERLRYLQVRHAAAHGDNGAAELSRLLAARLARAVAWVILVVQPSRISLGGGLAALGEPFLELLRSDTAALVGTNVLDEVTFSLAWSEQLGAMGAVALAMQEQLGLPA